MYWLQKIFYFYRLFNRDRAIKINGEFLVKIYKSLTANLKNYRQLFLTQTPLGQAVSVLVCLQEMTVL